MQATVSNQSTQNGVPVMATLSVVINNQEQAIQFAAGETVIVPLPASGTIQVKSPGGVVLATKSFDSSAPIVNFVYSEPYAWKGAAFAGWYPIYYQVKVTNPNNSVVSKVVGVLALQYYQEVPVGADPKPGAYGVQTLTIPANSYQMFSPPLPISGGNGFTYDIWTQDADGVKSAIIII